MRRARRRIGTAVVSAAAVVALGFAFSCRGPTQIKLVISTDVPCSRLKGVAITAGPYAYVEDGAPATITNECVDGKIGTLISTPAADRDGQVAFKIVAGVDKDVTQCTRADGYAGCSRQLRQLAYLPHETAELPIVLYLVCVGVACDPSSTCAFTGKCVPASVDPSKCSGSGCDPTSPVALDAAPDSAPTGDSAVDAPSDGNVQDAPTSDAPTDGPITLDGGDGGGACADRASCQPGDYCCTTAGAPVPACHPLAQCDPGSIRCKDNTDCPGTTCGGAAMAFGPVAPGEAGVTPDGAVIGGGTCL